MSIWNILQKNTSTSLIFQLKNKQNNTIKYERMSNTVSRSATRFRFRVVWFPRRRLKVFVVVFGVSACFSFLSELIRNEKGGISDSKSLESRVLEGPATETDPSPALAGVPRFEPQSFLEDAAPGNESHCRFNYGAPDDLEGAEQAAPSPGGGPYRVLYNVLEGGAGSGNVTYCTHATPELLYLVVEVARRWDGPVSVAVFAPLWDAGLCLQLAAHLCRCSAHMAAVSLHLVFPADAPPTPAPNPLPPPEPGCRVPPLPALTARHQHQLSYPVNAARNAARTAASTAHVLVADVELLPSRGLADGFSAMRARLGGARLGRPGHVFVVPVFEVEHGETVPVTKQQLVQLYARGRAVYFHRWVCLHCQRFPGLQRWLHRRPRPLVQPLLVVRREFPYHRWEPVFIGTGREPLYSEELSWEGQQDKMTQVSWPSHCPRCFLAVPS
ncbi:beta-1,4-glucuronyltransferase 1-like isoform X2 [Bacillus rossius redtenbacheri]|uniref:beta-1,4-glucuronyltransferase 1-like isoform X2 n=1 Tax=Bacillus rossius redtenbacheri TaxID=93214 RepID=UPI002FDDC117